MRIYEKNITFAIDFININKGMKFFYRTLLFFVVAISLALFTSCKSKVKVLEDGLSFCEAVYADDDVIYISNFGVDSLSNIPSNKGYILKYDGKKFDTLQGLEGKLSTPRGLVRAGNFLYVADYNCIHAVNLSSAEPKIISIPLPSEDVVVNHLLVVDDVLLISVSNSNHILALMLKDDGAPQISGIQLYFSVPGPNGMALHNGKLYIGSYNCKGENPTAENVIYVVDDFNNPVPKPFISRVGQYDGLAVDGNWLYFTDWIGGTVGKINLNNSDQIVIINHDFSLIGPAQITFYHGFLCIPDLIQSKIFMIND